MEFRTIVNIPEGLPKISHHDDILLLGSCFSEHIGQRLVDAKFRCDVNPFGILYNPQSILMALRQIMEGREYTGSDVFFFNERYRSYMHHGVFAGSDREETLSRINVRLRHARHQFSHIRYLLVTFGTSWVFTLKENGQVVANCHKMPASLFNRARLSVAEMVTSYTRLIQDIKCVNPTCRLLFTVSPIRHTADGAHGNQLSKAALLLAIEQLRELFPSRVFYFPSYEIVLDELRDYRFYGDDMVHPSPVAVAYVWERFSEAFFTGETQMIIKECERIKKDLLHRPFNEASEGYKTFLKQLALKISDIEEKYPNLDVEKEKERCHTLLNLLPSK